MENVSYCLNIFIANYPKTPMFYPDQHYMYIHTYFDLSVMATEWQCATILLCSPKCHNNISISEQIMYNKMYSR